MIKKTTYQIFGRFGVVLPKARQFGIAAARGDVPTLTTLLAEGVPVDAPAGGDLPDIVTTARGELRDTAAWSALMIAAWEGQIDAAQMLLDARANVNHQVDMATPLALAAERGNAAVIRLLLDRGARTAVTSADQKKTAMVIVAAAESGSVESVQTLLDDGVSADAENTGKYTALLAAVDRGHAAVARLLVANGADVTRKSATGRSVLSTAVHAAIESDKDDRFDVVSALLQASPELDLHAAAAVGDIDTVRRLIDEGAAVAAMDRYKETPLGLALRTGRTEIAALLLERGGLNQRTRRPLLALAADGGGPATVAYLLNNGLADLGTQGGIALLAAIRRGDAETVSLLLDRGVDVNTEDGQPLRDAASYGRLDVVRVLLTHGADPIRADAAGNTALTIAQAAGDAATEEILRR